MATKKHGNNEMDKGGLGFIGGVLKLIDAYGYIKIVFSAFLMVFISYTTYIALNPSVIFDRYMEYEEQRHTESFNYRMESTPIVQSLMDNMVNETGALRGFVIEMHNGKYNSSGLSFNYGSLTYESDRQGTESVKEDYLDFTLDRYPLLSLVHREGKWNGTIEELESIDKRLALKLESNEAYYVYLSMIYGSKREIGFIGLTFSKEDAINIENVEKILYRYTGKISPYLDGEKVKRN